MNFWFVILVSINASGTVQSELHWPQKPEYNNEKDCQESGQALADQLQINLGTNNSKVYFICQSVPAKDLEKLDKGI